MRGGRSRGRSRRRSRSRDRGERRSRGGSGSGGRDRRRRSGPGAACQGQQGVDVDRGADRPRGGVEEALEAGMLRCLHQSKMPIGEGQQRIAAQAAEHRQARLRGRLDEQLRVPVAPDAVVDDPGDIDIGPKAREAVGHRGGGGGHRPRVDHEHHRPPGGRRDVRGRAFVRGGSVEETHDAFDEDEIRIVRSRGDGRAERGAAHCPRVEVEARAPARSGMEGRIDVVRPNLERCDPPARIPQVSQQGQGHRRLSAPRRRGGDHDPASHGRAPSGRRPAPGFAPDLSPVPVRPAQRTG